MVEFGLKLEDNKVADWNDFYIQYEKLKAILSKCQSALKRYDDLAAKRPQEAADIKAKFELGTSSTPIYGSKENLTHLGTVAESVSPTATTGARNLSESTELNASTRSYGSTGIPKSESSTSLIASALGRATSGVSEYFTKSYERDVRSALKELDKQTTAFDDLLINDISAVNNFYKMKLEELEKRLEHLKESVAQSRLQGRGRASSTTSDDESHQSEGDVMNTPLIVNQRKTSSLPMDIARRLTRLTPRGISHRKVPSMGEDVIDVDVEDETTNDEDAKKLKEVESIQRALVDQYRTAKLLHNYAILNYTGFVKIVKKHDKTLKTQKGKYKHTIEPKNICNEGKVVEIMAEDMERIYANWFCNRNMSEARAQMLPKRGDSLEMDWSQLRLGYRMGMCSVLGLWVCWDCIWGLLVQHRSTIGGRTAFPVFRATGGLVLLQWFWGISVWVWSRYRINYIFLFDLDPRYVSSPIAIFNEAVDHTLVYLLSMLLYYKAGAHDIPGDFPAGIIPLLLVLYTILNLIFPLQKRGPMWHNIWLVVSTPTTSPSFFHGYIGDIFTSMVKVFQDMVWSIFFIISGDCFLSEDQRHSTDHTWSTTHWYSNILIPLVTLLPLWFRFNQCLRRYTDTGKRFPHLANALKYALSQMVTLFGAFHPLYLEVARRESDVFQVFWALIFVISSLYSFTWDVFMDWGLGRPKHNFLGSRLMYPNRNMYYAVMMIDLVLRFAWVLTLVPPKSGASFGLPQYLTAVSMILELFRRTVWSFLRLENEHRSNTAGFRRVGFVPLHFSTGHVHEYKHDPERKGFSVLIEVILVTLAVLGTCIYAVVAAQRATERLGAAGPNEL